MTGAASAIAVLACLWGIPIYAQDDYRRHNFSFAAGAGRPQGDIRGPLGDSPGLAVGYGYRFHQYFQADAGLDVLFGAADVRDYLETGLGPLRIRDREFLIPLGGRAILPLWQGRVLISGGGGGAYMRYAELLRQPGSYFRVDCPVCSSRGGWGYYALANASLTLDRGQHFRLGVTTKAYRGHTRGGQLGAVPGLETKDHWLNLFMELGFAF